MKTLDRIRNSVILEVRGRKDYQGKAIVSISRKAGQPDPRKPSGGDDVAWRRVVEVIGPTLAPTACGGQQTLFPAQNMSAKSAGAGATAGEVHSDNEPTAFSISMKDGHRWERRRRLSMKACVIEGNDARSTPSQYKLDPVMSEQTPPPPRMISYNDTRSISSGGRLQESQDALKNNGTHSTHGGRAITAAGKAHQSISPSPSTASLQTSFLVLNTSSSRSQSTLDREANSGSGSGDDASFTEGRRGLPVSVKSRSSANACLSSDRPTSRVAGKKEISVSFHEGGASPSVLESNRMRLMQPDTPSLSIQGSISAHGSGPLSARYCNLLASLLV